MRQIEANETIKETLQKLYASFGVKLRKFEEESESRDYGACRFVLKNKKILFRLGKVTPKKMGQFAVLWKRAEKGTIEPYDLEDEIDFFVVGVFRGKQKGQFVFSKDTLYKQGVLSGKESGGKRAIRVYPAWDVPTSLQAKKTQAWQLECFFEITENQKENISNIQERYNYDEKP